MLNSQNVIYAPVKKNIVSIFIKKYYITYIIKKEKYIKYKKLLPK